MEPDEYLAWKGVASLPLRLDPEHFRAFIYSHPAAEHILWYRTVMSPNVDRFSATYSPTDPLSNGDAYVREQIDVPLYCALILESPMSQMVAGPGGQYYRDNLQIVTMPDEIPLGVYDLVVPLGADTLWNTPYGRSYRYTETLNRGSTLLPGSGTLSSSGNIVNGYATDFLDQLRPGDILFAIQQGLRIVSIQSPTQLTLEAPPNPPWNNAPFQIAREKLFWDNIAQIDWLLDNNNQSYIAPTQVDADPNGFLVWKTPLQSPAWQQSFGITYWFYPKYIVYPDAGDRGTVYRNGALPLVYRLQLYLPGRNKL